MWPLLLPAVHSHKLTTSWFFFSLIPPTVHPSRRKKTHVTMKGLRPRPYSYFAQGLIRERTGRQGNEHLLSSIPCQAGCRTHLLKGSWAPNLFLAVLLALSLLFKIVFLCSLMYFSKSLSTSLPHQSCPNWQLHQLQRKPTLPTLGKGLSREYNGSGASGILQGS